MESVNNPIVHIIRRALGFIDARLIDHGERVAYIAGRIADMDADLDVERDRLPLLCLLHDVGAYKTEEIDDMVCFEMRNVMQHAIYGYVFLKNTTALGSRAEAILYHHTRYDELITLDTAYKNTAALIFLADRIDILLAQPGQPDWSSIKNFSGSLFSPALVELFFQAEQKYNISASIADGSYRLFVNNAIDDMRLPHDEVLSYLKMLVCSIDFRSPFTVTHTANTAAISVVLTKLFGLTKEQTEAVRLGAFLHDIGKISTPYTILENPGKLTPEQMKIMREHVAVSEEILTGIVSDEVCRIAVRHHEKLNGTGYHHGLSAEDLTLCERIVAVSDVTSALINRRSYKESFPKEKTLAILKDMRDAGELCPQVCNAVIDNFDYIMRSTVQADDPVIRLYENIRAEFEKLSHDFARREAARIYAHA